MRYYLTSVHNTSLYRRLIIANKEKGGCINIVGRAIHIRLTSNPKEGTTLLQFIYGQLNNVKPVMRYDHAPMDECPLFHKPESCTHIAMECLDHQALRINRHNAACQLVHAAIRITAKGGGALHTAPDIVLIAADTGSKPHTTDETLESLSPSSESSSSTQEEEDSASRDANLLLVGLAPLSTTEDIRRKKHTDFFQDPRYNLQGLPAADDGDTKRTTAPNRIPRWVLSIEETHELFLAGRGTTPDLIYARGVQDSTSQDQTSFNNIHCTIIIIEMKIEDPYAESRIFRTNPE